MQAKEAKGRRTDILLKRQFGIKIMHKDNDILLGDMFPVHKRYVHDYCKMR